MAKIYLFPYDIVEKNLKVIIYGGGRVGCDYIMQLKECEYCKLVAVVDMRPEACMARGLCNVFGTEKMKDLDFDIVLIAAEEAVIRDEIRNNCIKIGVDDRKIICTKTHMICFNDDQYINRDQWFGGLSYAQHGDDMMVLNIFYMLGNKHPSYLDIGAHHPYNISNTALLYLRGCRGINVEANPNLFQNFVDERPEDINVCSGVGPVRGKLPFYMVDKLCGRNSFDKESVEAYVKEIPLCSISEVKEINVVTLKEIVDTYADGKFPDYLTIDVEGIDYEILKNCDLSENGPKVITVEISYAGSEADAAEKIKKLMLEYGYFIYCRTGVNLNFVKNIYKDKLY